MDDLNIFYLASTCDFYVMVVVPDLCGINSVGSGVQCWIDRRFKLKFNFLIVYDWHLTEYGVAFILGLGSM